MEKSGTALYQAQHDRVRAARGKASEHLCIDCGGQARDWAQRHGTVGDSPDDYDPRCRKCHWSYDYEESKYRQDPEYKARQSQSMRDLYSGKKKIAK